MKVYLIREKKGIHAIAKYDPKTKECRVLKGSLISDTVSYSKTFRGSGAIEKLRTNGALAGNELTKDLLFKSSSTAANFVTGSSTNGMIAWKDKNGKTLRELIDSEE